MENTNLIEMKTQWGTTEQIAFQIIQEDPLYLCLLYKDDEMGGMMLPYADLSKNILGYEPAEGCSFVKNYSENEGIDQWLVEIGAAEFTGRSAPSGRVVMPEMRFNMDFVKAHLAEE